MFVWCAIPSPPLPLINDREIRDRGPLPFGPSEHATEVFPPTEQWCMLGAQRSECGDRCFIVIVTPRPLNTIFPASLPWDSPEVGLPFSGFSCRVTVDNLQNHDLRPRSKERTVYPSPQRVNHSVPLLLLSQGLPSKSKAPSFY